MSLFTNEARAECVSRAVTGLERLPFWPGMLRDREGNDIPARSVEEVKATRHLRLVKSDG